jgi:hypothetical protein
VAAVAMNTAPAVRGSMAAIAFPYVLMNGRSNYSMIRTSAQRFSEKIMLK